MTAICKRICGLDHCGGPVAPRGKQLASAPGLHVARQPARSAAHRPGKVSHLSAKCASLPKSAGWPATAPAEAASHRPDKVGQPSRKSWLPPQQRGPHPRKSHCSLVSRNLTKLACSRLGKTPQLLCWRPVASTTTAASPEPGIIVYSSSHAGTPVVATTAAVPVRASRHIFSHGTLSMTADASAPPRLQTRQWPLRRLMPSSTTATRKPHARRRPQQRYRWRLCGPAMATEPGSTTIARHSRLPPTLIMDARQARTPAHDTKTTR